MKISNKWLVFLALSFISINSFAMQQGGRPSAGPMTAVTAVRHAVITIGDRLQRLWVETLGVQSLITLFMTTLDERQAEVQRQDRLMQFTRRIYGTPNPRIAGETPVILQFHLSGESPLVLKLLKETPDLIHPFVSAPGMLGAIYMIPRLSNRDFAQGEELHAIDPRVVGLLSSISRVFELQALRERNFVQILELYERKMDFVRRLTLESTARRMVQESSITVIRGVRPSLFQAYVFYLFYLSEYLSMIKESSYRKMSKTYPPAFLLMNDLITQQYDQLALFYPFALEARRLLGLTHVDLPNRPSRIPLATVEGSPAPEEEASCKRGKKKKKKPAEQVEAKEKSPEQPVEEEEDEEEACEPPQEAPALPAAVAAAAGSKPTRPVQPAVAPAPAQPRFASPNLPLSDADRSLLERAVRVHARASRDWHVFFGGEEYDRVFDAAHLQAFLRHVVDAMILSGACMHDVREFEAAVTKAIDEAQKHNHKSSERGRGKKFTRYSLELVRAVFIQFGVYPAGYVFSAKVDRYAYDDYFKRRIRGELGDRKK